ncbi:MAG: formate C-acetyltransferase/glycerol dehydratase family glycyl radical enzyme [Armatimonadia bacterium]|nr:formate C-acetyltransferase/glycerol dehydratase family glycyl radical enzyme [Armatimonadia bacterium]
MTERVARLREETLAARPFLSAERAELVTRFYQAHADEGLPSPILRARCFDYILRNRSIHIGPDDLIVGERGPSPKATPTYPELCCHSLEDFEVMSTRVRTRYAVDQAVRDAYAERIIPFWRGRTLRERLFEAMEPEWQEAFEAGVFTEFMEQRAPGHAILDDKIYRRGLLDFRAEIEEVLARTDDAAKRDQLQGMAICCDAMVAFAQRHADLARRQAEDSDDPVRRAELLRIAEVCERVPARAPRDFHEAVQAYWFVHLGVISELNTWDSFNPGRLDQHLYPFYRHGLEAGVLTREAAAELLQCLWVKFNNQPAPPKVGITEEQSGTYTDFALINMGGVDQHGRDAVNDVSYLMLDVAETMRLVQPSTCIQVSKVNPDEFILRAARIIKTGFGQPSVFNTDVIVRGMVRAGKSLEDARAGGPSGCVTVAAFGKESCTLTGYCNWPKILELALNGGVDPRTGKRIGPATGDARSFGTFEDLMEAYRAQLRYFVDLKIEGNSRIEKLYLETMPAPFMSVLIDDCIQRGEDYHGSGPRYKPTYIQGVGLGTAADALGATRHHVYEQGSLTMDELLQAIAKDFEGDEPLRQRLLRKSPKYGNDDPVGDEIARGLFEAYFEVLDGRPNSKGGEYRVNLLPTTVHVYFGSVVGALPHGRPAGEPLSDGISPSQGADTKGPTAVVRSAATCIDHWRTGGTLLNQKFSPHVLSTEESLGKLKDLIRGYFALGGHHIQFNVVDAETLRDAQARPESHRDLIVRVAGYSDYFVGLGPELQEEIIARTEQESL